MRKAISERTCSRNLSSPKSSSAAYTAKQREQLQRGLHILARMIVRAHLRQESFRAGLSPSGPPPADAPDG